MADYKRAVFISYAWGGESERIANQIDRALEKRGLKITRDKREVGYKSSINAFMTRIGQGNCVIVIISDKYLRSPNCMSELVEIAENRQVSDRIFPVVLADADIYDPVKRLGYVKYWEDKRNELASAMQKVDPAHLEGIREDMDLYDHIRDKVAGLASLLRDMNTLSPELHQNSKFSYLYDAIEKRMSEHLVALPAESFAEEEAKEPASSRSSYPVTTDRGVSVVKERPLFLQRGFVIAYLLPASLFIATSLWFVDMTGHRRSIAELLTANILFEAVMAALMVIIVAVVLLLLNRDIFRFMEGYGKFNPLRIFLWKARQNYYRQKERLAWLDANYESLTPERHQERAELMKKMVERYPDQVEFVLPTAFGNAIRAFEIYPRVMYGLDGNEGWLRLQAVLPGGYREMIDIAKTQVDLWVNLRVVSFLLLIEFWLLIFSNWGVFGRGLFTVVGLLVSLAAYKLLDSFLLVRAISAAIEWGNYVKSAFDLYRFVLLESMGLRLPRTRDEEKALWTRFSQAILFGDSHSLPELKMHEAKKPPRKMK